MGNLGRNYGCGRYLTLEVFAFTHSSLYVIMVYILWAQKLHDIGGFASVHSSISVVMVNIMCANFT